MKPSDVVVQVVGIMAFRYSRLFTLKPSSLDAISSPELRLSSLRLSTLCAGPGLLVKSPMLKPERSHESGDQPADIEVADTGVSVIGRLVAP